MNKTVVVAAPAKVNLSFDVVGVREDGYHDVDTILQSVDLYDTVTVSRMTGTGIFISCDRPRIPCDETNYAHIAARLFFERFDIYDAAISIDIQKRIPSEAGLAGGSADAAGVLVAMNALFQTNASIEELCGLGVQVGADVPFCILGGTQRAQGIGNVFSELPALPQCYILIAKPEFGISTPQSYRLYDKCDQQVHPDTEYLVRQLERSNLSDFASSMCNVLEAVADLPEIPDIRDMLAAGGAIGSQMSGSGSAVFGIFENRMRAKGCMRRLYRVAQSVFLTRPIGHGVVVLNVNR